ncbi:MarR family transcriptional regulator [Nocardia sp. NPDC051832]|uniref:GbsR/MarR family transcriptional regulator n=1 Tax=Nocardia sp. NPDC051832 TaxID=3155673 RepID=UPI00341F95A9
MPGGRLTREDRGDIAAGLSRGLGYAEIARRLNRPTSTVSREVGRNGGPNRYEPERAHRATERRARRRTPTVAAVAEPIEPAVAEFIAHFTAMFARTGMPRTASGVLACLYAADTASCTAAELVHRLRVSPASISAAIRYLEQQDIIRRERDAERRRDHYLLDEDAWPRATFTGARQNFLLAEAARQGAAILGPAAPAAARLDEMSNYLDHVGKDMLASAERWRGDFSGG